uniref:WAP domain-containing protein n=1 Tax=Sinocyclocheilus anshuiensis TaxID=1608454 RepID=A0A671L517_9TELE
SVIGGLTVLNGFCPARLTVVPSRRVCSSDKDCPGGHKCCRFDCGPVCVLPVFSEVKNIRARE